MKKEKDIKKDEKLTTPLFSEDAAKAILEKFTNLPLKIRKRKEKKPLKIKPKDEEK